MESKKLLKEEPSVYGEGKQVQNGEQDLILTEAKCKLAVLNIFLTCARNGNPLLHYGECIKTTERCTKRFLDNLQQTISKYFL